MRTGLILAIATALSGCATTTDGAPSQARADTIRFAAGRCFGACPAYSVTVEPDGSGVLIPEKFTTAPGETRFTVTPLQYRRLRDSLAPFRPATGTDQRIAPGDPTCQRVATDMPSYQIVWIRAQQKPTRLDYYGGCHDPRNARLRAAIAALPATLDIQKMLTRTRGTTGKKP